MNPASAFVVVAIVLLFVSAVRYLIKNGPCAACSDGKDCQKNSGSCGGSCGGCPHSGACHQK